MNVKVSLMSINSDIFTSPCILPPVFPIISHSWKVTPFESIPEEGRNFLMSHCDWRCVRAGQLRQHRAGLGRYFSVLLKRPTYKEFVTVCTCHLPGSPLTWHLKSCCECTQSLAPGNKLELYPELPEDREEDMKVHSEQRSTYCSFPTQWGVPLCTLWCCLIITTPRITS